MGTSNKKREKINSDEVASLYLRGKKKNWRDFISGQNDPRALGKPTGTSHIPKQHADKW